jgi:flavorubredoxin
MAQTHEIAPDVFRISVYVPEIDLQFNHFLVRDDEPVLFHTGLKRMFPEVREAVSKVLDPAKLRWIGFSHFESDECGALNEWLAVAPQATAACSWLGALVSVNDFASRPARGLQDKEVLATGKYRFRFCRTPHLPHGWDAGIFFEETSRTLFCSDLFHQTGNVEPLTQSEVTERTRDALIAYQAGPLADYVPYTPNTQRIFDALAALQPATVVPQHGSAYTGNGAKALHRLADVFREVLGDGASRAEAGR